MKKLMIILSLMLTSKLYCPPAAPRPEGERDTTMNQAEENSRNTNNEATIAEHATDVSKKTSTEPTNSPKTTSSTSPTPETPSFHLDVEASPAPTITEVSHPDQNGFFSTKKTSTIITDHGDGTHSITNKEEVKGWFTNKTKSTTTKYKLDEKTTEYIKDQTKENPLNAINILKSKSNNPNKISTQIETGTKKYNSDGTSVETIKGKDGKATAEITYDKNNTPTKIVDSNGQPLSKSTQAQQAKTKFIEQKNGNLINNNEFKTSSKVFFNEDGHPVNEKGQLIDENGSLITQDSEGIWRNQNGELIDDSGNIIHSPNLFE